MQRIVSVGVADCHLCAQYYGYEFLRNACETPEDRKRNEAENANALQRIVSDTSDIVLHACECRERDLVDDPRYPLIRQRGEMRSDGVEP